MKPRANKFFPDNIDIGGSTWVVFESDEFPQLNGIPVFAKYERPLKAIEIYAPLDAPAHFRQAMRSNAVHELAHASFSALVDLGKFFDDDSHSEAFAVVAGQFLFPALSARPDWVKALFPARR